MQRSMRVLCLLTFAFFLMGFETSRVEFQTGATYSWDKDREMVGGLLFRSSGEESAPAVVLFHTCGGLLPHVTTDWPKYLTGLGYVVLTVDSYTPRGYSRCNERETWKEDQTKDGFGALDYLAGQSFVDGDRVALIGFSAGAFAINELLLGRTRLRSGKSNFAALISFYGRCTGPLRSYTDKDIPLMQIVGDRDTFYGICVNDWMKETPIEVHVMKGAYHGFDQPQITSKQAPLYLKMLFPEQLQNPMLYNHERTQEAREIVRVFLEKHL
jgi:dienelactone hydrolase